MNDIGRYNTVFCDSREALEKLLADGLTPDACVRTLSPYLLLHGVGRLKIQPMEAPVTGEPFREFKQVIRALGTEIYDVCYADVSQRVYARTIVRQAVAFQNVVLNAACLSDADFTEPRLVVRVRTGDDNQDRLLNGSWDKLLAGNPNCQVVTVDISIPVSFDLSNPKTMRRYMHQGLEYLGYRAGILLSKWAPWIFRKGKVVLLFKENELFFETAYHLARRRIRLEPIAPEAGKDKTGRTPSSACDAALRQALRRHLSRFVCKSAVDPCIELAISYINTQVDRQNAGYSRWRRTLAAHRRKKSSAIVLSNYPGRAEDCGLFEACNESGIPMIAFQHGVSREINANHGDVGVENAMSHLTLVYNETARIRSDETQFHHWPTIAVGFPTIGRRIARLPSLAFEKTEPILFVSTAICRGYVHMVTTTLTDFETCKMEIGIIKEVLERASHRVTYKPYPYLARYSDPDPMLAAAQGAENLTVVTDNIDMRYLIGTARVVVTSRATSTIGWCLMSDRPTCYIDVPDQMPLFDEARDAFEEGIFLFDASDPDFHKELHEFLSLPLDEIDRRWEEKRSARRHLLERFFDLPVSSTGKYAADYILKHCYSGAFFEKHPQRIPQRLAHLMETAPAGR